MLVVYKPAQIAVQTAQIGQADVVSELKNYLAGQRKQKQAMQGKGSQRESYLGLVHRLDQPVEGILVFGKTKEATAGLTAQLTKGSLKKKYYAVIGGQPVGQRGRLVDNLYKNKEKKAVIVPADCTEMPPESKRAVLSYEIKESVLQRLPDKGKVTADREEQKTKSPEELSVELSLANISIETGRFHQIRAQMAYHGMGLLGDMKYAGEQVRELSRQLGVTTVALCAYSLELKHPVTGKRLSFSIRPQGRIFQPFFAENL